MSKSLKIIVLILGVFLISILAFGIYITIYLSNVKIDKDKLKVNSQVIVYLDDNSKEIFTEVNGNDFTPISNIPTKVQNAFIAVEDKRFYQHKGTDMKALFRATLKNITNFSFKEGGSTITQQLIKNTQLTSEKTLKRKIAELKLARQLENEYSKNQILEMYLNTIYFGDGNYGITSASLYYFNKEPNELTLNEGACLAGIIKSPLNYSPLRNIDKANARKNLILDLMYEQDLISKDEHEINCKKDIILPKISNKNNSYNSYFKQVKKEINSITDRIPNYSKKLYVKTYYNPDFQEILTKQNISIVNVCNDYSSVIMNKFGKVNAFYITCGNLVRQPGSVLKPLVSYAPAIEEGVVDSCTIMNDEQVSFGKYKPKNYNNKYYGKISVRDSLSVSSNTCSAKLLNQVGVENALKYAKKTNISFHKEDNSLAIGLGCLYNGVSLINLTSTYNIFSNQGLYSKPTFIEKIYNENGQVLYKDNNKSQKVFSNDTASILNDMLENTVKNGTCRKLGSLDFTTYAKSGTVGNEKGNSDAYTISYTDNLTLGIWIGNEDGKLMDNKITGGGLPCTISREIYEEIYSKIEKPKKIKPSYTEAEIDKIVYEKNGAILLAEDIAPDRYKIKEIFTKKRVPKEKSTTFSNPKVEILKSYLDTNGYVVQLCQTEYINFKINKTFDGKKIEIYDSVNDTKNQFVDNKLIPNKIYKYSLIPYYVYDNKVYYGKEIFLDEIKTPMINGRDDNWWIE